MIVLAVSEKFFIFHPFFSILEMSYIVWPSATPDKTLKGDHIRTITQVWSKLSKKGDEKAQITL